MVSGQKSQRNREDTFSVRTWNDAFFSQLPTVEHSTARQQEDVAAAKTFWMLPRSLTKMSLCTMVRWCSFLLANTTIRVAAAVMPATTFAYTFFLPISVSCACAHLLIHKTWMGNKLSRLFVASHLASARSLFSSILFNCVYSEQCPPIFFFFQFKSIEKEEEKTLHRWLLHNTSDSLGRGEWENGNQNFIFFFSKKNRHFHVVFRSGKR